MRAPTCSVDTAGDGGWVRLRHHQKPPARTRTSAPPTPVYSAARDAPGWAPRAPGGRVSEGPTFFRPIELPGPVPFLIREYVDGELTLRPRRDASRAVGGPTGAPLRPTGGIPDTVGASRMAVASASSDGSSSSSPSASSSCPSSTWATTTRASLISPALRKRWPASLAIDLSSRRTRVSGRSGVNRRGGVGSLSATRRRMECSDPASKAFRPVRSS